MKKREALKKLLDAVECAIKSGDWKVDGACDPDFAIVYAKEALAQPEQEPIGFLTNHRQRWNFVANGTGWASMPMTIDWKIPLYTTPPQRSSSATPRKPLTEAERFQLRCQWNPEIHGALHDYLIQQTEAAHGIKE